LVAQLDIAWKSFKPISFKRLSSGRLILVPALLLLCASNFATPGEPAPAIRIQASETSAAITYLSWDTEGTSREAQNLLRPNDSISLELPSPNSGAPTRKLKAMSVASSTAPSHWMRSYQDAAGSGLTWQIEHDDAAVTISIASKSDAAASSGYLVLNIPFDPTVTPTALIPSAWSNLDDLMVLPAIVSAPDFGQVILAASQPGVTAELPGSRAEKRTDLRLNIPYPAPGSAITLSLTPLRLDPPGPGIDPDLWKLARRGWFNVFQPSSNWKPITNTTGSPLGMMGNNVISDPASFALWMYADQAMWKPELAPGISIMPSIRRTLEWWMDEKTSTTGECIGYWNYYNFLDSNPSLIITAWDYVEGTGDVEWLRRRIEKLEALSAYLERRNIDEDGLVEAVQSGNRNGLVEPDRSCCWWDAINCGHKDGYTNGLIYRAWRCLADLEHKLGRTAQQQKYTALADRLKQSYGKVLMNPNTGWLGWWRSKDGELHDYATPVVNGLAIEYGLVEPAQGKEILSRLRSKMDAVGFVNFQLGVPCFLEPVHRSDYLQPSGLGCPQKEDGKDTFQHYMNGAVSASPVLHFLAAHYVAGDAAPADSILRKMLEHLNAGKFQHGVTDAAPMGIDWADWNGNPTGYEGYLSDSFRFVQAVLLRNGKYRNKLYRPLNARYSH